MTKEEKQKLYEPKRWALYENGEFVTSYESHAKAKAAKHRAVIEAAQDMLDLNYEIKPYKY